MIGDSLGVLTRITLRFRDRVRLRWTIVLLASICMEYKISLDDFLFYLVDPEQSTDFARAVSVCFSTFT